MKKLHHYLIQIDTLDHPYISLPHDFRASVCFSGLENETFSEMFALRKFNIFLPFREIFIENLSGIT